MNVVNKYKTILKNMPQRVEYSEFPSGKVKMTVVPNMFELCTPWLDIRRSEPVYFTSMDMLEFFYQGLKFITKLTFSSAKVSTMLHSSLQND